MNRVSIKKTLDIDYVLDYLVVVPSKDARLFDCFEFTFGNTLLFDNTVDDVEFLTKFLRKNLVGQIIFVDYYSEYDEIINTLVDEHEIKFIFTGSLGGLSDGLLLNEFNQICNKYDLGMISEIAFLDYGLYRCVYNKRRNVKYVLLDVARGERAEHVNSNLIGLLNTSDSNYDSFYNELSSFEFLPGYMVRMLKPANKVVIEFAKYYQIETQFVDKYDDLFYDNICNLYVNFTGTQAVNFMKSMDNGIPCVVGNNGFLSKEYLIMNKYLVVESDDDVIEIARKVRLAIENKRTIMEEYKKFRKHYSKKAVELVKSFLGFDVSMEKEAKYEKLLTVIVPVYNTEKYLGECLESVVQARIPEMEILVINDGSTDNSEEIIREYINKYPNLIRYIKQRNRGLGNVRNVGLKQAKGKYLASVDSDDTVEFAMFWDALPYMKNDIDVVFCDWMSVSDNGNFETAALDWVFKERKEIEGLLYTTIMPSTCNKIMKKSLFINNKIEYLEQKYEDLSANPLALLKAKTVKYIRKPYYNYYLRNNSLMRSKIDPRQMVDVLKFLDDRLRVESRMINMEEFKYYTYSWRIEEYIINPLYEIDGKELTKAIDYINKKMYRIMIDVFESNYYREMLNRLKSKELRDYIVVRNKAFKDKKLKEFIPKKDEVQRLTPGIIYYGD